MSKWETELRAQLIHSPSRSTKNFPRLFVNSHRAISLNLLSLLIPIDTMASKTLARTLRTASKQKITAPSVQKRTIVSALATRPVLAATQRPAFAAPVQQQTRGVKTIDFAGTKETVYGMLTPINKYLGEDVLTLCLEREDWPREKLLVSLMINPTWLTSL